MTVIGSGTPTGTRAALAGEDTSANGPRTMRTRRRTVVTFPPTSKTLASRNTESDGVESVGTASSNRVKIVSSSAVGNTAVFGWNRRISWLVPSEESPLSWKPRRTTLSTPARSWARNTTLTLSPATICESCGGLTTVSFWFGLLSTVKAWTA